VTRLPSLDLYNEAIQHPRAAFSDRQLCIGLVRTNGLGLPLALGGGFAITYSVQAAGRTFAVRVFHKQTGGLEDRYRSISAELLRLPSPYFVQFEYQPQGIRVHGSSFPIVKMEWARGETLGSYLDTKYSDRSAIQSLRSAFRDLAKHLRSRGIAHGDIQTGNVMVDAGSLKLIDYDGMFVPGMPLGKAAEIGHRHFQHPGRASSHFGPEIDRFAFIALDLTLAALAEQGRLFPKYATTGENILFTGNDFKDPASSKVFAELRSIPRLRKATDDFAAVCRASFSSVPDLEDFLAGRNIPAVALTITSTVAGRSPYAGSLPVIDGRDFQTALGHVGDRVELIGLVTDVRLDSTRGGRPYTFINFGDWRGRIVKVNIWSTGLAKLREQPSPAWVGRWISVTGLMDPPYSSPKYHYTHLSVTVEEAQQLHLIDHSEAQYRLGKSSGAEPGSHAPDNRKVLEGIRGNGGSRRSAPRSARSGARGPQPGRSASQASPSSRNQAILQRINATAPTATQPQSGAPSSPTQTASRDRSGVGCLIVIAIVVILIVLAKLR
jgi:serine/threonine protein kinase